MAYGGFLQTVRSIPLLLIGLVVVMSNIHDPNLGWAPCDGASAIAIRKAKALIGWGSFLPASDGELI